MPIAPITLGCTLRSEISHSYVYMAAQDVVKAVGVMAPAVKQTLQSAVNPLLHFDGVRNLSPEKYREHVSSFFKTHFQPRVDLHLLCSKEVCSLDVLACLSMLLAQLGVSPKLSMPYGLPADIQAEVWSIRMASSIVLA